MTAAAIAIEPAKIEIAAGEELAVDEAGNVMVSGEVVATLSSNGRLTKLDGALVLSLDDEGVVTFAKQGLLMPTGIVEVDGGGTIRIDGETVMRIDDAGVVWTRGEDGELAEEVAVFEGATATRRAIALLLLSMLG